MKWNLFILTPLADQRLLGWQPFKASHIWQRQESHTRHESQQNEPGRSYDGYGMYIHAGDKDKCHYLGVVWTQIRNNRRNRSKHRIFELWCNTAISFTCNMSSCRFREYGNKRTIEFVNGVQHVLFLFRYSLIYYIIITSGSILSSCLFQMEKYSKHLELIVADRTQDLILEKQKTDRLLYSNYT